MDINKTLDDVEKNIDRLDKLSGYKKATSKEDFLKLSDELKQCDAHINECENVLCNNSKEDELTIKNDEEYEEVIEELDRLSVKMENSNMEKCLKIFKKCDMYLAACEKYILSKKLDVVNL